MSDNSTIVDEFKSVWEDFKGELETAEKSRKEQTAETKQALDRANDRLDDLEAKLTEQAKRFQRPDTDDDPSQKGELDDEATREKKAMHKKAFATFLRKGQYPTEAKALAVSDDTLGGFLAPDEFVQELIKGIVLISPVRQIARVRQTSNNIVKAPKRTGLFAAQWTSEKGTRSETTGLQFGLEEIPTHELYALVDISLQDLEDSVFDLEGEIRDNMAEQFAVAEGLAFVKGDAVGKPEGLVSGLAAGVGNVNSGTAGQLKADDLIAAYFTPKTYYVNGAYWLMNRDTIRQVRQLKDANGQYLWNPGVRGFVAQGSSVEAGIPAAILDRPYLETVDLPNIGTGAKAAVFGNFQRAYWIVDRISDMQMLRDPYTQATVGNIRFIGRKRVGGQIVLPEALCTITIT